MTTAPGWGRRFPADERIFLWLVLGSVVVMSAFTIGWLFLGRQNVPTSFERTTPAAWGAKVSAFAARYQGKDGRVHVPVGTDAYMMAADGSQVHTIADRSDVASVDWQPATAS